MDMCSEELPEIQKVFRKLGSIPRRVNALKQV